MTEDRATLFLSGDVMTGRGIDQVLAHPCPPHLYEPYVSSALDYVALAEKANGPIPHPVDDAYVWGAALDVLADVRPHARVINLETTITTSETAAPKGINYRMHPGNIAVLTAAAIDCCVLANNHVLDWGEAGLLQTLDTLGRAGICVVGAGRDIQAAHAPVSLEIGGRGRVLVFAFGSTDSGISMGWAAGPAKPGVQLLPDFSDRTVDAIARVVAMTKTSNDVVVASIHWGGNWGYDIPSEHRGFAHALIDRAGIDVIYGHSSHHPRAIEVYRDRLILYGCGDFLNDYEGISGHEEFRSDLVLMYLPTVDVSDGRLVRLEMTPLRIRNFRLHRSTAADRDWLVTTLDRECRPLGSHITLLDDTLALDWS
jgi:poly-gamma-glutamate synthesis protein (capsule biosynthesis protein)